MSRHLLGSGLALFALACTNPAATDQPDLPAITISSIVPALGSTGGATPIRITGTGFSSSLVSFGGVEVQGRFDHRDPSGTVIYVESPPHPAGAVDVVLTGWNAQVYIRAGGYTFAEPASFEFNGSWMGYGNAGQDIPLGFSIQDNRLVSVWCDEHTTLTFSDPPVVSNGAFSYSRDGVVVVSGRIVSATDAVGTIDLGPCSRTNWVASR